MLKGVPASPGIAIGKAFIFTHGKLHYDKTQVATGAVEREVARFELALSGVQLELSKMRARTVSDSGKDLADSYETQMAMLDDPAIKNDVLAKIRGESVNAEAAVAEVLNSYMGIFHALRAAYLRERVTELKELTYRLQRHLLGSNHLTQPTLTEDSIVLAKDLTPAETIHIGLNKMLGLATERGGRTSHTAIMARNLDIPSVVGIGPFLPRVREGDTVILDGSQGTLIINPDEATLADYRRREETYRAYKKELQALQELPAETVDHHRVELLANIDHSGEVAGALANGAGGIGLFRTEYLFMARLEAPDEEEQYQEYKKVAESMGRRSVIIRTLDIGGEGNYFSLPVPAEPNPFLGWRGVRLSLELKDIFKTQIRAILRAGAHGNVRMMFPMVSNLSEWQKAKAVVNEAKKELAAGGALFDSQMGVGVLVEVPSVALTADLFVPHVDFFSIGTNDLVQYTMAVDRGNEKVSALYQSLHPAVLRLMDRVAEEARKAGKEVAVCGEMAGEPLATVLLAGMGIDTLSCGAGVLPEVKKRIRSVTMQEARGITRKALTFATAGEVRKFLESEMRARHLYF